MTKQLIALLLLVATAGTLQGASPVLEALVASPHEREGDYDALAVEWMALLAAHPRDPLADVVVDRLDQIAGALRSPEAFVTALSGLLTAPAELSPVTSRRARDLLAAVLQRLGRESEIQTLDVDRGFLQHWAVLGPLGLGLESQLGRSFPAETDIDLGARVTTRRGVRRWLQLPPIHPPRFIDARQVFSGSGIYLHLAQVRATDDREVLLHLEARSRAWVTVNGRPVLRETGDRFRTRPVQIATVLLKGWNRILVKLPRPGFSMLVTDRAGNPLGNDILEMETNLRLHDVTKGNARPDSSDDSQQSDTEYPLDWKAFAETTRDVESLPTTNALSLLALAWRARFRSRPELSVHYLERALTLAPENPAVLYQVGTLFRRASHLSAKYRRRRALSAFERAVQQDPGFLAAQIRIADYHYRDEDARVAIKTLQEVLATRPDCLPALELSHRIYDEQEWHKEALATAQTLARAAPGSAVPYRYMAQQAEERWNLDKAILLYREALARDATQNDLYETVARLERDRGKIDEAFALLERSRELRPGQAGPILALVDLLEERGEWQKALDTIRPLERRAFGRANVLQRIAALQEGAGKLDDARQTYRQIVERFPGELATARYLEQLDASTASDADRFWTPYDETLTPDKLREVPSGEDYPEADSLAVLDIAVLKIHRDGTTSEYIHQAMKVLSEASEENLARVRTAGEVVELRTLQPDGTELEPVPALGQESFVMPGLEPGSIVEHAYRHDSKTFDGWLFRAGPFYFQDFNYRTPFLLTRYVLLVPPDFDVDVIERGFVERKSFANVKRVESELPDGGRAIVYEASEAPRMRPELNMPNRDDYIPNVHLMQKRSWKDVADWLADVSRGAARSTPELEEFAKQGVKDAGGGALEKAHVLYDQVHELIKTDQGPRDANGILLEKAGNRTVLYKALLDAVGVPCHWAFARPRPGILATADFSHPSPDGFGSQLVALELPDQDPIWITLDKRKTPFGKLPYYLHGGTAIVLRPGGAALVSIEDQQLSDSAESLDAHLTLGADNDAPLTVEVELSLTSRDYSSCARKTAVEGLDEHRRELYLHRLAAHLFPGARVNKSGFADFEAIESPLKLEVDLIAPEYLTRTGDDLLLKSIVQPLELVRSFIREAEREHPYNYAQQLLRKDRMEVDLGDGLSIARLPDGALELCPLGAYALRFIAEGQRLIVEREVRLEPGALKPEEYPRLIAFCRAVDEAESARIVLRRR
jgi:tetratricopeptide (TPR) repeat protein